jgi:hypothetical protein
MRRASGLSAEIVASAPGREPFGPRLRTLHASAESTVAGTHRSDWRSDRRQHHVRVTWVPEFGTICHLDPQTWHIVSLGSLNFYQYVLTWHTILPSCLSKFGFGQVSKADKVRGHVLLVIEVWHKWRINAKFKNHYYILLTYKYLPYITNYSI